MLLRTHCPIGIRCVPHGGGTRIPVCLFTRVIALLLCLLTSYFALIAHVVASPPRFASVLQGTPLAFPRDYGSHPAFRTEWWYVTGWLETGDKKPLGFQVTFFRSATEHDPANPSRFAPRHLIIAHAALSDPAAGKLLHGQKSAREGFGLAYAKEGNTDVKLDDWNMQREENGRYQTVITAENFILRLSFSPTQATMLQGDNGFSRKGPRPEQASYYYSEPQLRVAGTVFHNGEEKAVTGTAWLDHEWSSEYLDPEADGWDWVGAYLDDGSALMAFQIRGKDGGKVWAYAGVRDANGQFTRFKPEQVDFQPQRTWRSPRTEATYPVAMRIQIGSTVWSLDPLYDDQELDSRQTTGAVYWEGAVTVARDGKPAGRGYFEMTGYVKPLRL